MFTHSKVLWDDNRYSKKWGRDKEGGGLFSLERTRLTHRFLYYRTFEMLMYFVRLKVTSVF